MRIVECILAGLVCLSAVGADQATTIDVQEILRQVDLDNTQASQYTTSEGSFSLPSDVLDDPQVECRWATARTNDGRAAPRAQDVVLYFHQPRNLEFQRDALFRMLVERCGFTVFGVRFPASSEPSLFSDRNRFYAFSQSGSFTTIKRALSMLRERLSLPENPAFLFGYSAGGIGVQRFAEEYPDLCAGVVSYCGHSYVQKKKARCPFLIVHNFGDNPDSGLGVEAYYRNLGTPVIRLVLPPAWDAVKFNGADACHYQNHAWIDRLVTSYLMALSDSRRDPAFHQWPLRVSDRDRRVIVRESQIIPEGELTIGVPSLLFYGELLRVPPDPIALRCSDGRSLSVAIPGSASPPRALITFVGLESSNTSPAGLSDTLSNFALRYAASLGFIAVIGSSETFLTADYDRIAEISHTSVEFLRSASVQICLPAQFISEDSQDISALLKFIDDTVEPKKPHTESAK